MKKWLLGLWIMFALQTSVWSQQDSLVSKTDSSTYTASNAINAVPTDTKNEKYLVPAIIVGLIIAGTILLFNVRSK